VHFEKLQAEFSYEWLTAQNDYVLALKNITIQDENIALSNQILQNDELPGSNEKTRATLILNSVKAKEDSLKKLFHISISQFVDRNK
jgi:hypothetical protein